MSKKRSEINENRKIDEDFNAIEDLLTWQKYFFTIGGFWPMEKTYIRASIFTMYLGLNITMEYCQLFAVFGNLNSVVMSLLESAMQSMVFTKLIVFRHSTMLRSLLEAMKEDFSGSIYENYEEKKLYLKYNYLSKLYYKLSVPYIISAACLYYLRPILTTIITGSE